jgi:hypothetical protein
MSNRKMLLVGGLCLALILSGCNLNFNTTVRPDGAGIMIIEVGYATQELEAWLEESNVSAHFCEEVWSEEGLAEEFPPGATLRVEQRGLQTWCIVEFPFSNLRQLRDVYEDNFDMEVDRLEIVNETFYCDLTWDLEGLQQASPFPIEVVFRLIAPGRVTSTNADVRSGRTLTWHLDENGENAILAVSSTRSSDWVGWVVGGLCCLCLGVLAVAGGIALVVYLRRQNA